MRLLALALAIALVPTALAVDVLPEEASLGDTEARILVRTRDGKVHVEAQPPVLAAASAPEGEPGAFEATPRAIEAAHTWHGLDGIVVVVLRRDSSRDAVEIVIDDASQTGIWLDWPPAERRVPFPAVAAILLVVIAAAKGFPSGGRLRP